MLKSMTGYGKAEYCENGITLTVELRSVNNRFLDLIPKYPRAFVEMDDAIRKTVQKRISRGRVELFVSYTNVRDSGKSLLIDKELAGQYVEAAKLLKDRFDLEMDFTVSSLMRSPDVLTEKLSDEVADDVKNILIETLDRALDDLDVMRVKEGAKLVEDVLARAAEAERLVGEIGKRAPQIKEEYARRIKERVEEILGGVNYDEARLLQEVALFADKTNIDEELTRPKSHISQLREICRGEDDAGKKLDFLMQEFNRETNTICSKSNDIPITKYGLALKNEIEKMREQVQNIE